MHRVYAYDILGIFYSNIYDIYFMYTNLYLYHLMSLMGRVFAKGMEDRGSIPDRVKPKI